MRTHRFPLLVVLGFFTVIHTSVEAQTMNSDVGGFFPFLKSYSDASPHPLSFLARPWSDIEQWRIQGRAKMQELLAYDPAAVPLAPEILWTREEEGFVRHLVRYAVAPGRRTEAYLLIPNNLKEKTPAVIALHCHSGYYYSGKEKISDSGSQAGPLNELVTGTYGGRYYADELARRGYVVLVPDCFYFGSQRLDPTQTANEFTQELEGLSDGTDDYIRAFNSFASRHESLIAKTIFAAGSTWPGIMFSDDRVSLSYLLSRQEVDPDRVGCIGLSIGGYRSAHLFGLDPRIKVGVVAGWMTTFSSLLFDHLRSHTWMLYVPRENEFLDLPDVVSLNAPRPLMVIDCLQDALFTLEGEQAAEKHLATVYEKLGAQGNFKCNYYDVPHCLNVEMQDDAFEWLDKGLRGKVSGR
jgi:dienelactone hydrolase